MRGASSLPERREGAFDLEHATALSARSVASRLLFAGIFGAGSLVVLPWTVVGLWYGALLIWELAGRPLSDKLIASQGDENSALRMFAPFKCLSAAIYATLGYLALAGGHPVGMVLGAAWLTGSIGHTFVYYGSNRALLIATMTPACAAACIGVFTSLGAGSDALVAVAAILSTLAGGSVFLIDRKALLRKLDESRLAAAIAEESNRAKSQFLAVMSHELRTPLNAIIGYSEMMREGADEDSRARDLADHDRVLCSAQSLLRMINGVLDLSKIEAGRMDLQVEPLNIETLAHGAFDTVAPQAKANGNTLRLALDSSGFGATSSDSFKLHQCLVNLLANAAKFTKNGVITMRVRRERELLIFEVEDTGIGIPADKIAALFLPFAQADASTTRKYGGTGLGLAIAKGLAQMLGGDISAESTLGKGSVFRLSVPANCAVPQESSSADAAPSLSGHTQETYAA
jgi:signal transduction histidine kinase